MPLPADVLEQYQGELLVLARAAGRSQVGVREVTGHACGEAIKVLVPSAEVNALELFLKAVRRHCTDPADRLAIVNVVGKSGDVKGQTPLSLTGKNVLAYALLLNFGADKRPPVRRPAPRPPWPFLDSSQGPWVEPPRLADCPASPGGAPAQGASEGDLRPQFLTVLAMQAHTSGPLASRPVRPDPGGDVPKSPRCCAIM